VKKTVWLSFVEPGKGFLGVAIVDVSPEDIRKALREVPWMKNKQEGPMVLGAVIKARDLGINPGGEVQAMEITAPVDDAYKDRLLSKWDLKEAGFILKDESKEEESDDAEPRNDEDEGDGPS